MSRPASLTAEQQAALARDWMLYPPRELEARYGISSPTLYAYRRRLNLPKRGWIGRPLKAVRVVAPRPKKPEPQTFPFRWFPPKQARIARWRCACTAISTDGPVCSRCRTQEAA